VLQQTIQLLWLHQNIPPKLWFQRNLPDIFSEFLFLAVLGTELKNSRLLDRHLPLEPPPEPFLHGCFWDRLSLYAHSSLDCDPPSYAFSAAEMAGVSHNTQQMTVWAGLQLLSS
jgi:hypothetical protein